MLRSLRDSAGGVHRVFTAVAAMKPMESARDPGYILDTCVEETEVKFDQTGRYIKLNSETRAKWLMVK
jgi:septum formation protein